MVPCSSYFPTASTWGIGWRGDNSGSNTDIAGDVWADQKAIYVCGTLEENSTNARLSLTKFVQNYYVRGELIWNITWTHGSATYGKAVWSNGIYIYTAGKYTNNLVLIKWDENGTQLWNSTWNLGGNFGDVHSIWGIEDNIYLSGVYVDDLLLIKWNENGMALWNRTWGNSEWEEAFDVWGANNEIYTCGSTSSYGAGSNDSLIIKWDTNGNQIWNRTWGTVNEEYYTSIFGFNTSIYACGSKWDATNDVTDVLIMKWVSNGTQEWRKGYGGAQNHIANSIWVNEYYAYIVGTKFNEDKGIGDMLFLKYTYSGVRDQSLTWGAVYHDIGKALYVVNQNLYICGTYGFYQAQYLLRYFSYDLPQPPNLKPISPNYSQNGTCFLEWDEVKGNEIYKLYKDIHPILNLVNRTPYQTLTSTNYTEVGLEENTYFYVVTSTMKDTESVISNPRIVLVDLPNPPKRKIPGYNIYIILGLVSISIICITKRKNNKFFN